MKNYCVVGDDSIEIEVKSFDSWPSFPIYGLHYLISPNLVKEVTSSLVKQGYWIRYFAT